MIFLFDIVFQNGDFYGETSTSLGEKLWSFFVSLSGIGIPLLLFYLGLKAESRKENKRKITRQSDNLKYFAILIENIKVLCVKQSENCKSISEKILHNPFDFPVIEKTVGSDIKRIVNLVNHEDIFHAYIANFGNTTESITDFRIIFSYLDYLDKLYDQHLEDYENYKKKFSNKYIISKNISDDLLDYVAILINKIRIGDSEFKTNSFWNYINEKLDEYYRQIKELKIEKDIESAYNNFIRPIKEDLICSYSDNIYTEEIISRAQKATYIHTEIIDLSVEMKTDFEAFNTEFKLINDKLIEKTSELIKINAK